MKYAANVFVSNGMDLVKSGSVYNVTKGQEDIRNNLNVASIFPCIWSSDSRKDTSPLIWNSDQNSRLRN